MKFSVARDNLLKPLQNVNSIINNNRTKIPILDHLLLTIKNNQLIILSTDLEIEVVFFVPIFLIKYKKLYDTFTMPSKKFFNICKNLPEKSEIHITIKDTKILIYCNRSKFILSSLSSKNFPNSPNWKSTIQFNISQEILKKLIENTYFSMAYNDIRYYLNGLLLEYQDKKLQAVATDGHRLAYASKYIKTTFIPNFSIIIPRKFTIEIMRLLKIMDMILKIEINKNNIRFYFDNFYITSKLIDGIFPNYKSVFPKNFDNIFNINADLLKQALIRVSILSNQKSKGIRFLIKKHELKIIANNSDHEEAEEKIDIIYDNKELEISFNVNYLLDILSTMKSKILYFLFTNAISSTKIQEKDNEFTFYIVMPMRL